jgi:hypothetical protein
MRSTLPESLATCSVCCWARSTSFAASTLKVFALLRNSSTALRSSATASSAVETLPQRLESGAFEAATRFHGSGEESGAAFIRASYYWNYRLRASGAPPPTNLAPVPGDHGSCSVIGSLTSARAKRSGRAIQRGPGRSTTVHRNPALCPMPTMGGAVDRPHPLRETLDAAQHRRQFAGHR